MREPQGSTLPAVLRKRGVQIARNALVAAVVVLGVSFLFPNKFTASTLLLPPTEQGDIGGLLSGISGSAALSRAFGIPAQSQTDLYLGILRSETVQRKLSERFDLRAVYGRRDAEKTIRTLASHTRIVLTNEGFVRVSVTEKKAALAAQLANAYAEELDQFLQFNTNRGARLRREFLGRRLEEARDSLVRCENLLRDYQIRHRVASYGGDVSASAEGIGTLVAEKLTRELELGTLEGISVGRNPRVEQLRAELRQIDRELERIPPATTDLARLVRTAKVQEKIVLVLTEEYEHARLIEMKNIATVEVVDAALPPLHKSQPRRGLIAIGGLLAAAAISIALYWLREGLPEPS